MRKSPKLVIAGAFVLGLGGFASADRDHGKDEHASHMAQGVEATGLGVLMSINVEAATVSLDHAPIPALEWPAMTMELAVSRNVPLTAFADGDKVQFTVKKGRDGVYRIMLMCKTDEDEVVNGLCDK